MTLKLFNCNKYKKSQVAAEFTILLGFAMIVTMVVVIFLYASGKDRTTEKIDYKMYDFGASLQNEFILTSQMNDGYVRLINLKDKIEETNYNITIIDQQLLEISYNNRHIYFRIPRVIGSISKGNNIISKVGEDIYLTQ